MYVCRELMKSLAVGPVPNSPRMNKQYKFPSFAKHYYAFNVSLFLQAFINFEYIFAILCVFGSDIKSEFQYFFSIGKTLKVNLQKC